MAEMNLLFPNPVKDAPADVLAMEQTHELLESVEFQRGAMIDYLDVVNYMNGFSFDDPIQTRHVMAWYAVAMSSLAYLDPHKTREMRYNLGLVVDNMMTPHLDLHMMPFNSDNVRLAEQALACALYRLVSGHDGHDATFHDDAEALNSLMWENLRVQHVCGIDTARGSFQIVPNAMALLALEIHDRIFGSRYADVCGPMAETLFAPLTDPGTGLYFEDLRTTSIGHANERVAKSAQWHTTALKANVNGLAIAFMNRVDPADAARTWASFKERLLPALLELDAETVGASVGTSYLTQLGRGSEDLLAAMFAAREMDDSEAFAALEEHFIGIAEPNMWEGHVICAGLGDSEAMVSAFWLPARVHVGWEKLLGYDWKSHYGDDFVVVR